jgi:hypothetical protein
MVVARHLVGAALIVVVAGSLYQLAVGLKLLHVGDEPGEGPPLERLFLLVPVYVLALGGGALVLLAFARRYAGELSRTVATRALPLAAAAFPLCLSTAFDPYYLPTLRRFWTVNTSPPALFVLVILALGVTVLAARRPGATAVALTGALMVVSGILSVGEGLH